MTKALQKKFVVTAMAAITLLLLLLLGAINVVNSVLVSGEIERTLELIWQSEGGGDGLFPPPDPAPRGPEEGPKNAHDTVLSSNYFLVRYDQEGAVAKVDVSRTSAVTEEEAQELAAQVYAGEREEGQVSRFRYLRREAPQGGGVTVVFSYIRVLLLSAAAGLGCWGLMLVFVILLSRRAIRPIAENIERQKQFVTNAGHEIKTPLAIIQSNTEAMELYLGESKWSRNIKEQTRRLSGLMQDLLTLARMDEGAAPAQKAALSLSGLAEQALEPLPAAHGGPGHRLGAGHSAGGVPHRRPGPAGAAALPATGQRREVHRPRGAHPPLCKAGGEAGSALPGKHLPPAAHGAAGKAVRPLLPGGRRPHPEGRRLWHWSGGGPLPGPGKPGQPARPVPSAPSHPVCGAIPQLNTQNPRTDRGLRPVFLYVENHSLGEWFQRRLVPMMKTEKLLLL